MSNLTFEKGTTLLLDDGTRVFEYLVSKATASQTFTEGSRKVKTIHNPLILDDTYVTEKGRATLTFSVYLESSECSRFILEWFGFPYIDGKNILNLNRDLKTITGYIKSNGSTYKLSNCVAQTMSFIISPREVLRADITATCSLLEDSASSPAATSAQNYNNFYNSFIDIPSYPRVVSTTLEIVRDIDWLQQKSLHHLGSIYVSDTPIVSRLAIGGTIVVPKTDNAQVLNNDTPLLIKYGSILTVNLDHCNLTSRWEMGNYHTTNIDYKLLPISTASYIKI
jgi:hypothetical protein